jgi:hypothetical protein
MLYKSGKTDASRFFTQTSRHAYVLALWPVWALNIAASKLIYLISLFTLVAEEVEDLAFQPSTTERSRPTEYISEQGASTTNHMTCMEHVIFYAVGTTKVALLFQNQPIIVENTTPIHIASSHMDEMRDFRMSS